MRSPPGPRGRPCRGLGSATAGTTGKVTPWRPQSALATQSARLAPSPVPPALAPVSPVHPYPAAGHPSSTGSPRHSGSRAPGAIAHLRVLPRRPCRPRASLRPRAPSTPSALSLRGLHSVRCVGRRLRGSAPSAASARWAPLLPPARPDLQRSSPPNDPARPTAPLMPGDSAGPVGLVHPAAADCPLLPSGKTPGGPVSRGV